MKKKHDKYYGISFKRRCFYLFLDYIETALGVLFVWISAFLFFYFDTWVGRIGSILSLGAFIFFIAWLFAKIWPDH